MHRHRDQGLDDAPDLGVGANLLPAIALLCLARISAMADRNWTLRRGQEDNREGRSMEQGKAENWPLFKANNIVVLGYHITAFAPNTRSLY